MRHVYLCPLCGEVTDNHQEAEVCWASGEAVPVLPVPCSETEAELARRYLELAETISLVLGGATKSHARCGTA